MSTLRQMEREMGPAARLGVSEELAKSDHTTGYLQITYREIICSQISVFIFVRPLPVSLIPNT